MTAHLALEHGLACNTAGGTHHAQHAAGSGFCIINDLAITALQLPLAAPARVRRVLVLDLDVHQGDGTAQILQGREPAVFTVSVHAEKNFPARKQRSSLDVGLDDGVGDEEYLRCPPPPPNRPFPQCMCIYHVQVCAVKFLAIMCSGSVENTPPETSHLLEFEVVTMSTVCVPHAWPPGCSGCIFRGCHCVCSWMHVGQREDRSQGRALLVIAVLPVQGCG